MNLILNNNFKSIIFFILVLLILVFCANIQYLSILDEVIYKEYLKYIRDLVFLTVLFFSFSSDILDLLNYRLLRFTLYCMLVFLVLILINDFGYSYYQHFFRNLFFYPLATIIIFRNFKLHPKFLILCIPLIDIFGFIFNFIGILNLNFYERYELLFLSPTVSGYLNFLFLLYHALLIRKDGKVSMDIIIGSSVAICAEIYAMSFLFLPLSFFVLIYILFFKQKESLWIIFSFALALYDAFEDLYLRFYNIINFDISDSKTITGRLEQFSETITGSKMNSDFSVTNIIPLDSSYLFVLEYMGSFALLIFVSYKFFYLIHTYNLYKKIHNTESLCLFIFCLIDIPLAFIYNLNFSYIYNLFLFSFISLTYFNKYELMSMSTSSLFKEK